jgi:hypothetical protein
MELGEPMIEVTNKVKIYEVNVEKVSSTDNKTITICSHWADSSLVVIIFPESPNSYALKRSDLETAMQNATNTRK